VEDKACPVFYSEIRPQGATVRADAELLPFMDYVAVQGRRLELGLEAEALSTPAFAAQAEDFAAIAPCEVMPSQASGLEVASAVVPEATAVRLPLPIAASQPTPVLAGETEALRLSYSGITPVTAATPAGVDPLRFAAEPGPPAGLFSTSNPAGLQIAIESTPTLPARAEGFAAATLGSAAPNDKRGLALAVPARPGPMPALSSVPVEMPAHAPRIAGENAVIQISYPEVRVASASAAGQGIEPELLAAVASAPRLPLESGLHATIESAPASPAQVEDFAPAAPLGASAAEPRSVAVELPVVPEPTPVLPPLPVETPAHALAPAPTDKAAVLPISYPQARTAAVARLAPIEPLPFAAVAGSTRLPGELGLQIEMESALTTAARVEDFAAVKDLFPAAAETAESTRADTSKPADNGQEAPDFERHPPAEADLVALEYFCQRSRIIPASHSPRR